MSMTLLQLLKEFCARRGLPMPTVVVGSGDDQLLQLMGLLNEVLEDLTTRYVGTALKKSATWDLIADENQGELETLCPYGFKWVINGTFWDRTQRLPVLGPVSEQDWAAIKATPAVGVWLQYRMMGGNLLLNGSLIAGHKLALEYASDWSIKANDGSFKQYFSADSDVSLFPSTLLLAGLNWKWRLEKGFKYAEQFRTYEAQVSDFNGHDGTRKPLSMDGGRDSVVPGIFVPTGNWRVN